MASAAMKNLRQKEAAIVSGRVKHSHRKAELFNPDVVLAPDRADDLGVEPLYSLSSGLTQKKRIAAVRGALDAAGEFPLPESLPPGALERLRWPKLADALALAHNPPSIEAARLARQRIAFEEMSMQQAQLALFRWKHKYSGISSVPHEKYHPSGWRDSPLVSAAVSSLPFDLTSSQLECLDELWADATGDKSRMLRLLQGMSLLL